MTIDLRPWESSLASPTIPPLSAFEPLAASLRLQDLVSLTWKPKCALGLFLFWRAHAAVGLLDDSGFLAHCRDNPLPDPALDRLRREAKESTLKAAWAHGIRTLYAASWLQEKRSLVVHIDPAAQLFDGFDLVWPGARLTIGRRSTGAVPPAATAWYHLPVNREQLPPTEAQLGAIDWLPPKEGEERPGTMVVISPGGAVRTERYQVPKPGRRLTAGQIMPLPDALQAVGLDPAAPPRYSLTLVGRPVNPTVVLSLLVGGIKLFLFLPGEATPGWLKEQPFDEFREADLLGAWTVPAPVASFQIIDGRAVDPAHLTRLQHLGEALVDFNYEQWAVEHALQDADLAIAAGAGTGKTKSMVNRVQFLLHTVDGLRPAEITMITFTREATRVMRERLRKALQARYRLTGQQRYLKWLEELAFIQISTIPSFARRLLQAVGSALGFGQGFRIRNFKRERDQIIEAVINEELQGQSVYLQERLRGPLYKFIEVIQSFWTELENKGLGPAEIANLDWGTTDDSESAHVQALFQKIFTTAEARLQALKERENAIALPDLTRQLHLITDRLDDLERDGVRLKYLFVDEFQDADDTQIRLVAAIRQYLGARVFVVGDVKQSIYRFRGATYTAFEALQDHLKGAGVRLTSLPLQKNYRTSASLLQQLDEIFQVWGAEQWLPYQQTDRLKGVIKEDGELKVLKAAGRAEKVREQTLALIREGWPAIEQANAERRRQGKPPLRMAVLVRTNRQADMVKAWCDAQTDPAFPFCEVQKGGTLFASAAAHDLHCLVRALLHPHEPLEQLNLLATPFSQLSLPWPALLEAKGQKDALLTLLKHNPPHPKWAALVELTRQEPILSVIRQAIDLMDPVQRCYDRELARLQAEKSGVDAAKLEAQAQAVAIRYRLNLERILELAHETFQEEFATLYGLGSWLELQRAVNRDEDEPPLPADAERGRIYCVTVHGSKGDEFHTVIIPFTDKRFRTIRSELLLKEENGLWKAGWLLKVKGKATCKNSYHDGHSDSEEIEALREETRLLYVALTRTERRLWILRYEKGQKNWGWLLREGE
jgi:superfamily I DNA/RNA helicase